MKNYIIVALILVTNCSFAGDAQFAAIETLIKRATISVTEEVQECYGLTISTGSYFINKSSDNIGKEYLNLFHDCVLKAIVKRKFSLKDKTQFDN